MTGQEAGLARLREAWPAWEFWLVPRGAGGTWWCARLKDDHSVRRHGLAPEHLDEYLSEWAGIQRS